VGKATSWGKATSCVLVSVPTDKGKATSCVLVSVQLRPSFRPFFHPVAGVCFVSGAHFGSKLEEASDTCVKGRAPGVGPKRALGIFDHELRII
jgi:hypothetical protein